MPQLERTEAVVLLSHDSGEADREVVLLTRTAGKVYAQVRGARKITSRLGGSLEPFTTVEVMLYRGPRRATVTGVAHAQTFRGLRADLGRFAAASVFVEAVDTLVPQDDQMEALYPLVVGGLDLVASDADRDIALSFVLTKLLTLLGYAPDWGSCAACHRPVDAGPYGLSADLGGVVAGACAGRGLALSPPAWRTLGLLAEGRGASVRHLTLSPTVRAEVRGAVFALVARAGERPLRSVPFYEGLAAADMAKPASTVRMDP